MHTSEQLRRVGAAFGLPGGFVGGAPYGNGHINDTYAAVYEDEQRSCRYILQRINNRVFAAPESLMDNVRRVTEHMQAAPCGPGGPAHPQRPLHSLQLIAAREGDPYHRDTDGRCWRCYVFVEGAQTYEVAASSDLARDAAESFGQFQAALLDLPGPPLAETIPRFHDLENRAGAFETAVSDDPVSRAAGATEEIGRYREWFERLSSSLEKSGAGALPERVVHNDCKLNNVLLADDPAGGAWVIDLDTVMNGSVMADFGDMVRTMASTAPEDEADLSKVSIDMTMFSAVANGYISAAKRFLCDSELGNLALAGPVLTFETGLRFLTDHLAGDTYFRVRRDGHNLVRCRAQLELLESMVAHGREMEDVVGRASAVAGP